MLYFSFLLEHSSKYGKILHSYQMIQNHFCNEQKNMISADTKWNGWRVGRKKLQEIFITENIKVCSVLLVILTRKSKFMKQFLTIAFLQFQLNCLRYNNNWIDIDFTHSYWTLIFNEEEKKETEEKKWCKFIPGGGRYVIDWWCFLTPMDNIATIWYGRDLNKTSHNPIEEWWE